MQCLILLRIYAAKYHKKSTRPFQTDFGYDKAPVNNDVSRGSFVETAGIEPASEKRTTPGTTGIFAG